MLDLSKKNQMKDIAAWAHAEDILDFIENERIPRIQKDFYFLAALKELLARLKTLEDCTDEIVAEKIE